MAKKKKSKGGKKKKVKWDEDADIFQRKLMYRYLDKCEALKCQPCKWLMAALDKGIKDRIYARKYIIEPDNTCRSEDELGLPVKLRPVIFSIRSERFVHVHEICVWDIDLEHSEVADLALLMEKGFYPISRIELMDCNIPWYSIERLAKAFYVSNLSEVNLDYNDFGDEGCAVIAKGLKGNKIMVNLSLCFCGLTSSSGASLGEIACHSAVREFYLDGNSLECEGTIEMLRYVADFAEEDMKNRVEEEKLKALMITQGSLNATDQHMESQMSASNPQSGAETDAKSEDGGKKKKKKKKGKKKGKKKEAEPPLVGPYVHNLHLSDNGIDAWSPAGKEKLGDCIEIINKLLMYSNCLAELDLADNAIGEVAACEMMAALEKRKIGNLPGIKLRTTVEISKNTFNAIFKLASGLQKKKKKGKGKKKKKKK